MAGLAACTYSALLVANAELLQFLRRRVVTMAQLTVETCGAPAQLL